MNEIKKARVFESNAVMNMPIKAFDEVNQIDVEDALKNGVLNIFKNFKKE